MSEEMVLTLKALRNTSQFVLAIKAWTTAVCWVHLAVDHTESVYVAPFSMYPATVYCIQTSVMMSHNIDTLGYSLEHEC